MVRFGGRMQTSTVDPWRHHRARAMMFHHQGERAVSRLSRTVLLFMLVAFGLACSLISAPLSQVQNLASTAEAIATSLPSTAEAIATSIPSSIPNIPNIPDVSGYLNPTGTPASEWNGIPIMPQATSGQEFTKSTYSFKSPLMPQAEVESFYDTKLKALGWTSEFSASTGAQGGILVFSKEGKVLTITVARADQGTVVLLILE
jgi:hypothetical protein